MKVKLLAIGALTSKPYAFTARSWELNSNESIDFFDALGSNIRVDTRGSEIMRILPKINNKINEEWISDKIRFSYDGLKQQRLNSPMLRVNDELKLVDWKTALLAIQNILREGDRSLNFILGNYVELETQFLVKLLSQKLKGNVFFNTLNKFNNDFSNNYLLNIPVEKLQNTDLFFFIGVNLRLENPVLNLKIRRRVNEGATVITFGCNSNFYDYPIINIGNDTSDLVKILEGKHGVSARLQKANSPLVLAGSALSQRYDYLDIFSAIKNINKYFNKNIVSYLASNMSEINFMELGFVSQNYETLKRKIFYIIGADNVVIDKNIGDFIIYQGQHGDHIAGIADIILPGSSPFEKIGTYINLNGVFQTTKFIQAPPGNARNDWKILKALGEVLDIGFEFANINQLSLALNRTLPRNKTFVLSFNLDKEEAKIIRMPLASYIDDYYLNDSILRSSYIMSLSSNRFNKKLNFIS